MNEDRSYYASRQLASLFFTDANQALPGVATVELLQAETAEAVFNYYTEMLNHNLIDIFVLGDVRQRLYVCSKTLTLKIVRGILKFFISKSSRIIKKKSKLRGATVYFTNGLCATDDLWQQGLHDFTSDEWPFRWLCAFEIIYECP